MYLNRFWCQTCDETAKSMCEKKKHNIMDVLTIEEHDRMLVVQVKSKAQEALSKREKGEKPLVTEQDQLKAKLNAVKI